MPKNNFDFLRILSAIFIVVAHSYDLTATTDCDWLCWAFTNHENSLSYLGLRCLFIISGFLILQSLLKSENVLEYILKRVLRIFPGLYMVLVLTVILGVFVYQGTPQSYWNNSSAWTYLPNNLFLYNIQYSIDGIFQGNPYNSAINGSLWTIPYEFTLYLLIIPLFWLNKRNTAMRIVLFLCFIVLVIGVLFFKTELWSYRYSMSGDYFFNLSAYFIAGSILATFEKQVYPYKKILLSVSFVLLILSLIFSFFNFIQYLVVPVFIISFGLMSTPYISIIKDKVGDLSYGVYIYSFPIQQTLLHFFKFNPFELMVCSLALSLLFAYFSWHIVEARALKLKKYLQFNFRKETTSSTR